MFLQDCLEGDVAGVKEALVLSIIPAVKLNRVDIFLSGYQISSSHSK